MSDDPLRAALVAALHDRYRVDQEPLGSGGMAQVYGARDLRHGRRVAIKILRPEQAPEFGAERFLREINLTANLQHPHILPLLESGAIDHDGVSLPFYVMPLVVGGSLRTRLDATGALPLADAVAIARDVGDGLRAAHDRGLIHRDIKPENILLSESGAALIADLGVARGVGPAAPIGLTEQGMTVGTPAYMSPEQLFASPLGPATDQFSLAAVIFEMLAGRPPFLGQTREELITRRLTEPMTTLGTLRPDLPAAIDQVVMRGLEREPGDRFPTVTDLVDALALAAAATTSGGSQPAIVAPVTSPARTPVPVPAVSGKKRWSPLVLGAGVVALVVALGAGFWWSHRPARTVSGGAMVVLADVENLTADSTLGPALRIAAAVGLQQSSSFSVYPRTSLGQSLARMGRQIRDTVLAEPLAREIAVREGGRAVIVLTVTEVGGKYSLAARVVDPATGTGLAAKQVDVGSAADLLEANGRLVAWARRQLGDPRSGAAARLPLVTTASLGALQSYAAARRAYGQGHWDDVKRALDRAIEQDTGFAMAQAFLGEYLIFVNDVPNGLKWLREADKRTPRLTEPERLKVKAQLAAGEGREAERINLAGELATRFPSVANYSEYGEALRLDRRWKESIEALERGRAIDSTNPDLLYDLAIAYRGAGDRRAALDLFAQIARIDSAFMLRGNAPQEWGRAFVESEDLAGAEAVFRRLSALPTKAEQARGRRLLAYLEILRGRFGEAARLLRESVALWVPGTLSEYRDQVVLADVELTLGNAAGARAALDRVYQIFRETNIQAAALMFAGRQYIRAQQLPRARLFLDSLAARAALRPNSGQDQAALALLRADLALAGGKLDVADAALRGADFHDYETVGLSLLAELHSARGRPDSAAFYARRAKDSRIFALETQLDWQRGYLLYARMAEAAGDSAAARGAYSELIELWQAGDSTLPPLVAARRELARLQGGAHR